MKTKLFYLCLFGIVITTTFVAIACSSESRTVEEAQQTERIENYLKDKEAFDNFMYSVDSLNSLYSQSKTTRGLGQEFAKKAADVAGKYAGKAAGRIAGASIGFITVNPAIACLGHYALGEIGAICGSIVSSYFAGRFIDGFFMNVNSGYGVILISDSTNINAMDSLGIIHNNVMKVLSENTDRHYIDDNNLNYDIIYDDCISALRNYGLYNDTLTNPNVKESIINFAIESAKMAKSYHEGKITTEEVFEAESDLLKKMYTVEDYELNLFKNFGIQIATTSSGLSKPELIEYSKELNEVINESQLTIEQKTDAASTANIMLNSTICWGDTKEGITE